jgi:hypothetical protein
MKISQLSSFLSVSAITLATTLVSHNPALSQQKPTFVCGTTNEGEPATIVQSPQHGDVPIIVWKSGYFEAGGYDDRTRCNMVTQRFQDFSAQDTLKYFTAGKVNGEPVICVVPSEDSGCNSDRLLFTLKRGSDAQKTLQTIFDIRAGASATLYENSNPTAQDRLYVDFDKLVESKASEGSNADLEPTSDTSNSDSNLF